MGKWMAANLVKSGYSLRVNDKSAQAVKFLVDRGAKAVETPSQLAPESEFVFLSLPSTAIVEKVIFGESGLLESTASKPAIIDLSTTGYLETMAMAQRLEAQGYEFADAPVSGMEARAKEGTLTLMFGGKKKLFDYLKPFLSSMANNLVYMGGIGSGQLAKLVNQLLFDINVAGLAEVLPMATKLGLDPEKISRVVCSGTGQSFAADFFLPHIQQGRFNVGYPLEAAYKDLANAALLSTHYAIPLPLVQAANTTFQLALAEGLGSEGKGALIKVFEKISKTAFRKKQENVNE
jgi:3-hydroxyisobutyrate dehydrogenase-like beta-hydroxyacid dehydrogenase